MILTLKSSDGEEFLVSKSAAVLSVTIRNLVEDLPGDVIPLPLVDGGTLAKVLTFLNKHDEVGLSDDEKEEFDEKFLSGEQLSVIFDVLLAANYLNIKGLLRVAAKKIADVMKNKSVRWVRKTFGVENDFTPEEEKELAEKYGWAWQGADNDSDDSD